MLVGQPTVSLSWVQVKSAGKSCVNVAPHLFGQSQIGAFWVPYGNGSRTGLQGSQVPPSGAGPFSSPWRGGKHWSGALQWSVELASPLQKSTAKSNSLSVSTSFSPVECQFYPILGYPLFPNKSSCSHSMIGELGTAISRPSRRRAGMCLHKSEAQTQNAKVFVWIGVMVRFGGSVGLVLASNMWRLNSAQVLFCAVACRSPTLLARCRPWWNGWLMDDAYPFVAIPSPYLCWCFYWSNSIQFLWLGFVVSLCACIYIYVCVCVRVCVYVYVCVFIVIYV